MKNEILILATEVREELNWLIYEVTEFDEAIFNQYGISAYVLAMAEDLPLDDPDRDIKVAEAIADFDVLCDSVIHLSPDCVKFISLSHTIVGMVMAEDFGGSIDSLVPMRMLMIAAKSMGRALALAKPNHFIYDILGELKINQSVMLAKNGGTGGDERAKKYEPLRDAIKKYDDGTLGHNPVDALLKKISPDILNLSKKPSKFIEKHLNQHRKNAIVLRVKEAGLKK